MLFFDDIRLSLTIFRVGTTAVELQIVTVYGELMDFFHEDFDFMDSGIAEFDDRPAGITYDVIVLAIRISTFVVRLILSKLVPLHQTAFNQKIQGIVNGGTGNPIAGFFHLEIHIVGIKVPIGLVNFLKDHKSLRSLAMTFLFEVTAEDFFDFSYNIGTGGCCHKRELNVYNWRYNIHKSLNTPFYKGVKQRN